MDDGLSVFIAFGAGLLSFLSPCVLPLIPSYLCVIGGSTVMPDSESRADDSFRPQLVARTICFILGFSAVFIVLSVILSATFMLMGGLSFWINIISGAIVIVLGLNVLFDFLKFLNYEKRFRYAPKKDTPNPVDAPVTGNSAGNSPAGTSLRVKWLGGAGAFAAGAAFGAGWTPCVGPILSGILILAAGSSVPIAVLYLAFYSLGLGLPFLLASIFFNVFLKTSRKIRKYLPAIRRISGALLILIGILIITGRYQALNIFLSGSSL